MAVKVRNRNGKEVTLLNPAEKGRKYAAELKNNVRATNDHKIKRDESGKVMRLSKVQRSYRAGYLDARKDGANCYKAQQKKKKSKRANNKPPVGDIWN